MTTDELAKQFNDDWWASQPADVQKIRTLPTTPMSTRGNAALAAQEKGLLIDFQIVVWGWDPFLVHTLRTNFGCPYIVGAMIPGTGFNGVLNTPLPFPAAPPGMLPTVEVDATDDQDDLANLHRLYPLPQPPAPPPPAGEKLVGAWYFDDVYMAGPGAHETTVQDGKEYQQDGKTYTAIVHRVMMGYAIYFRLKKAA